MTTPRLVWSLCVASLFLVLTGPVLLYLTVRGGALIFALAFGAIQIFTAVVGAVVASRLPENAVGWILLGIGTALGLTNTSSAYGTLGTTTPTGPLPGDDIAAWMGSWSFVPVVFGGVMLLIYVFPDGHFLSAAWRRIAQVSAVIVACATFVDALIPGQLDDASEIENPVVATGWLGDVVSRAQTITDPLALPVFALAAVALIVRFRRSHGIERQQLKWISFALILVAVSLGLTAGVPGFAGELTFILALFALAAMPIAIGFAMLRYRLYDIDLVINRTLVYGVLTATLAAVYLGSVLLLQLGLNRFTEGSSLAIAISTLAVAALFRPARGRIQDAVDLRFFRHKYDAGQTLERFAVHMRGQVDLTGIGTDLLAVVTDTVQPAHASLWLRTPKAGR
jgi:hypothetical protein